MAQPEASKPRKETASSSLAQREAEQNERLGKVVGAVVALALEGQSLPLDIAKSLLHRGTQAEVIRRAQASVVRMRESGIDVDLMEVGRVLSNLDETVVQQIRD